MNTMNSKNNLDPRLSPGSLAILNSVRTHRWADADVLQACVPNETSAQFRKRLRRLVANGWLVCECSGATDLWFLPWRAHHALERLNAAPETPTSLVPPRRINVMTGTYTPPSAAPARRGAMDFAAVASQGMRC